METVIIGERGQITIPKKLRDKFGIKPKSPVVLELKDNGILIKPSVVIELRDFSDSFIKKIIKDNEYKDNKERKGIFKKWGFSEKDIP